MKKLVVVVVSIFLGCLSSHSLLLADEPLVFARMGGEKITLEHFKTRQPVLSEFLGHSLSAGALEEEVGHLVFTKLLAREALIENLDEYPTVKADIEDRLSLAYLRYRIPKSMLDVQPNAIEEYYKNNITDFYLPRRFHIAHILVSSMTEAEKALGMINRGMSFKDVAKRVSIDPATSFNGGDLGWLDNTQLLKKLSASVVLLSKGEISDIVKTGFGYHVIKLFDIDEQKIKPLRLVRQEIHKKLSAQRQEKLVNELKAELWEKHRVSIDKEGIGKATLDYDGKPVESPSEKKASRQVGRASFVSTGACYVNPVLDRKEYGLLVLNSGNSDLAIGPVESNCKCIQIESDKEKLQPGEMGEIIIKVDNDYLKKSKNRPYAIAIGTNDPNFRQVVIPIRFTSDSETGSVKELVLND